MGPWSVWSVIRSTARLSTALQILIFLPLTLSTLSTSAFLLLSLLLFVHSLIYGTLTLLWPSLLVSVLEVPVHPILLLVCFNTFSTTVPSYVVTIASLWGNLLYWSSPALVVVEGISSLLIVQRLGQIGKGLVLQREGYQFGLLVAAAAAYVTSAWWIVTAYPSAAQSPLSSTLLGVALTTLLFLTIIGFALGRTNIIESSGLSLFLAYNVWLCGVDQKSIADFGAEYAPLLSNIMPHLQTLVNFIANTLPKPVLFALLYRLLVLHFASQILPTIGADSWESDSSLDDDRPTSKLTRILLTYRQSIFIAVYSHLLLLDPSSQVWWRWMNIFCTLALWALEMRVGSDEDVTKDWKVD